MDCVARRRFGMGELGSCGVVGHGGGVLDSPFAKIDAVELRGSNIVNVDEFEGLNDIRLAGSGLPFSYM